MATPRATTAALPAPTSGKAAEPGRTDWTAEEAAAATDEAAPAIELPTPAADDEPWAADDWLALATADDWAAEADAEALDWAAAALD
jgi:2-keto-4-pentenoate hydratase